MEYLRTILVGVVLLMTMLSFQALEMETPLDFFCAVLIGLTTSCLIIGYIRTLYLEYRFNKITKEEE